LFKRCVEKARMEKELMKRKNHWQGKKGKLGNKEWYSWYYTSKGQFAKWHSCPQLVSEIHKREKKKPS